MNTDHQDRVIQIWQAIAKHYKGNTWVAGYNKLNEPADPDHVNLQAFYDRIFPAIREIDSDHILFPDGNTYVRVKSVGFFFSMFLATNVLRSLWTSLLSRKSLQTQSTPSMIVRVLLIINDVLISSFLLY